MPYLFLSLAAIFWGGNYVVGKLMVVDVDPVVLSEIRWMLTSALLVAFNFNELRRSRRAITQNIASIVPLAILGQVIFPVTLYIGLQYTTSLNAAIYLSATPGLVLTLNWLVFRDAISRANIIGVVVSSAGVVWLVTEGNVANLEFLKTVNKGDYWTILSAISWAIYCSFLRKKPAQIAGNVFVTACSVVGAVVLAPFAIGAVAFNGAPVLISPTLGNALGIAYLIIFPSWLSYLLWSKGIAAIGATRGEIFTHLIPLTGGLLSIVFLGVPLRDFHIVSVIVIAVGVALCSLHGHKPAVQPSRPQRGDTDENARGLQH